MHFFHHRHHDHHHAIRHGGHPGGFFGFGHHFGEGFGPRGAGRGGFGPGRKLGSADLQLLLLALLAEKPSHGYELIKALEERSGGFYAPSPGMIYPALTYLEEVGYASVSAVGAKKLYSITASGSAYLAENQQSADAMLAQLEHIGRKMGRVREIFGGLDEGEDEERDSHEVHAARRELKQALREQRGASPEEKSRIAGILKAAAEEIRRKR